MTASSFWLLHTSFPCRSAASFLRAKTSNLISNSELGEDAQLQNRATLDTEQSKHTHDKQRPGQNFQFPFGDWLSNPWLTQHENQQNPSETRFQSLLVRTDFSVLLNMSCYFIFI